MANMIRATVQPKVKGFTLLEVLVALLVLSIGLLGLAGLQVTGLRDNHSAYLRSQAVLLAQDMADRMRQNRTGVNANNYMIITLPVTGVIPNCISTVCTAAQIATADANDWALLLTSELPLGIGSVVCTDSDGGIDPDPCTNGSVHIVTVQWDDNKDSVVDAADPSVVVNVRP